MDTEDHDLAEVTHHTALYPDSSLERIDYREVLFKELPTGPIGSIRFPEQIRDAVEKYLGSLPDNAEKPLLKTQLESTYRIGSTFAQSFAELMFRILPESGLILFDPSDVEAKQLTSEVFQTAIRREDDFRTALLSRSRQLESSGFHAQVSILENSTVLFLIENGQRHALERRGSRFRLKNTDQTFGMDELLDCAAHNPEKLSPNVLLRPLVQDHLFPTAAYVGGSSELAYFAQIQVLYELYGRPMPVIWPRDSFTLLEPEVAAEMDRLEISISDCFEDKELLIQKAVRNSGFSKMAASLDELHGRLNEVLTEVKPELRAVDPPLERALETARRKILHNVQHLKVQVSRFEATGASVPVDFLLNNCYPNRNLQERELGIHYFLARHGSSMLDDLRSAIETGGFDHHVLRL
jgi:bacillithiol biosynthesis cysteine-adding enzyme BshC